MNDEEIRKATLEMLAKVPSAMGVNNHMGSRASSDPRVMRAVLSAVRERGLYFIDSRTTSGSLAERTARELGVRSAARQIFLDDDPADAAIRGQLRQLEERARRDGTAVAIGHLLPSTLRVLEQELPRLREAGISIVPPSTVVH